MPYLIRMKLDNGESSEIKKIANDNPKSPYGFEDRKILYKANNLCKKISKLPGVSECICEHYNETV